MGTRGMHQQLIKCSSINLGKLHYGNHYLVESCSSCLKESLFGLGGQKTFYVNDKIIIKNYIKIPLHTLLNIFTC